MTGAVINYNHIESRQFLESAKDIVLEYVKKNVMKKHYNVKVNTIFNGGFVTGDKRINKSINTRNFEVFRTSDLREWYERHVIESTLASLKEFQERDSKWAPSQMLNLTVNVNEINIILCARDVTSTVTGNYNEESDDERAIKRQNVFRVDSGRRPIFCRKKRTRITRQC